MGKQATIALLALLMLAPAGAGTVSLEAGRDATLIQTPDGSLANGSGPALFVGRTGQFENSVRRALLYFDVAAAVPRNAVIESAELTMTVIPSNTRSSTLGLYRVEAAWAEGPSFSAGGQGAASQTGDVTWLHNSYDTEQWVRPGGHFIGRASAETTVTASGDYTWETTPHLVQDVRLWKSAPKRNFGWILIGDETQPRTAKAFASRETGDPTLRPRLQITYRLPGANRVGNGRP